MTDPIRDLPCSPTMPLGVGCFTYADLYEPAKLHELHDLFDDSGAVGAARLHALRVFFKTHTLNRPGYRVPYSR